MSFCVVPLVVSLAHANEDAASAPAAQTETTAPAPDGAVTADDADSDDCENCCSCQFRFLKSRCCKDGCGRICWSTTGDMHPHYPYFPRHHGYFYYRPYNYIHVLEHQYQALSLGGDPRAPYHNRQFERVYERHAAARYEEQSASTIFVPTLNRTSRPLPNIQDILESNP
ncbi:MAG: hypothetical protein ACKVT0_12490 [Planctomycetaceae bacterium]